jgi:TnpA family transposase
VILIKRRTSLRDLLEQDLESGLLRVAFRRLCNVRLVGFELLEDEFFRLRVLQQLNKYENSSALQNFRKMTHANLGNLR